MILDDYWFLEAKFLTTHWAEWLAFFETLSPSIWKKLATNALPYQPVQGGVFDTMGHKIAPLSASDARVVKSEECQRTLHCFTLSKKFINVLAFQYQISGRTGSTDNGTNYKKRIICKSRNEWPSILEKPFKWHFGWGMQFVLQPQSFH